MAPLYFVVWRRAGVESPSLYHDHLPGWIHGKHAASRGVVYVVRLDTLSNGERWAAMGLDELWRHYCRLRDKGRLPPPGGAVAPTRKPVGGRQLGDWWKPPPATWDQSAPGMPHPRPDRIKPKPNAPARIRE